MLEKRIIEKYLVRNIQYKLNLCFYIYFSEIYMQDLEYFCWFPYAAYYYESTSSRSEKLC